MLCELTFGGLKKWSLVAKRHQRVDLSRTRPPSDQSLTVLGSHHQVAVQRARLNMPGYAK
jgi:hypothetical protein